ncbi:MAG: hypothetical protein ACR2GX_09625 [Candidatus Dormibacteria bacterium]
MTTTPPGDTSTFLVFSPVRASITGYTVPCLPQNSTTSVNGPAYYGTATTIQMSLSLNCGPITWDWGNHSSNTGGLSSQHTYRNVSGSNPDDTDGGGPSNGTTITARQTISTTITATWHTQFGTSPVGNILCNGASACVDNANWSSGQHLIEQIEALPVNG